MPSNSGDLGKILLVVLFCWWWHVYCTQPGGSNAYWCTIGLTLSWQQWAPGGSQCAWQTQLVWRTGHKWLNRGELLWWGACSKTIQVQFLSWCGPRSCFPLLRLSISIYGTVTTVPAGIEWRMAHWQTDRTVQLRQCRCQVMEGRSREGGGSLNRLIGIHRQ